MTVESTAASDVLAVERHTHWNYFEAVICIYPDKHAKSNWDIVQNPLGDPHISSSLSLRLYCCVPLKVISIAEKLALVIPNRDCSLLVYHLSNAQESCSGMPNTWTSPHLRQLKIFVCDSHPAIAPKTRKGGELKTSLHNLNTERVWWQWFL